MRLGWNPGMKLTVIAGLAFVLLLAAGCSNSGGTGEAGGGTQSPSAKQTASPKPMETADNRGEQGGTPSPGAAEDNKFDYAKIDGFDVIADELRVPWSIAFDGDSIYISERSGSIVQINDGKQTRQKVRLNRPVKEVGEGGFLGLVLAPDFSETKQAYAYHTYEAGGGLQNRIVLLKLTDDEWVEKAALLEGIPGAKYHNGGRLAIGPDGNLYATTGDAQKPELAQQVDSLAGKILRMSLEGNVPADNPFEGSYVYSYGHRNSQGLAWDSDAKLYETEHGPSGRPGGHDELNQIEPGANYGWPDVIGDQRKEGMVLPLYHAGDNAIAPSGAAVDGNHNVVFATLVGETLYRYDTKNGGVPQPVLQGEGRLRDVKIHNGHIYVITNNTDGRGSPEKNDDRLLMLKIPTQ